LGGIHPSAGYPALLFAVKIAEQSQADLVGHFHAEIHCGWGSGWMQDTQKDDDLESLLCSISRRDSAAFALLRKATAARMFGIAYRILGNRADAEEVVGDVYTRIWYCRCPFDPAKGGAPGWLATVCRNAAFDCIRRARRHVTHAASDSNTLGSVDESPETALERLEIRRMLAAAIEQLPHPQQHFLALSFKEGLSHREISTRYEIPLGTVKSHLNRTLKRLRRNLQPLELEQGRSPTVS
jgi:RNA polymerase sigma-70 factor, ECF subfamily